MNPSSPGERRREPTSRNTSLRRGCCIASSSLSSPASSLSPTGEWSLVSLRMLPFHTRYSRESPTCPMVICVVLHQRQRQHAGHAAKLRVFLPQDDRCDCWQRRWLSAHALPRSPRPPRLSIRGPRPPPSAPPVRPPPGRPSRPPPGTRRARRPSSSGLRCANAAGRCRSPRPPERRGHRRSFQCASTNKATKARNAPTNGVCR